MLRNILRWFGLATLLVWGVTAGFDVEQPLPVIALAVGSASLAIEAILGHKQRNKETTDAPPPEQEQ
jgi:hypothetical protein